ncbi:hypothetical protein C8F04DRAFT_1068786 [Mycena alexandri]|uniref:Uncharacterized protein n=1 Tax=Mycena alexandri TaxID=1745969 RepID=A0AAD6TG70_9AGAR|nr:hypothetical protein C8F04DRAFT_1068786 [Mycena alexandri]
MLPFRARHILPLLVASALTYRGGMIPFWNPDGAIREFGLPEHIAVSQPAPASFITSDGKVNAVDPIMALLGYVGAADAYVCWQEGVPNKAIFRGLSGLVIGGWGALSLTEIHRWQRRLVNSAVSQPSMCAKPDSLFAGSFGY